MDLTKIKGPSFLKELTEKELNDLAKDIRQFILNLFLKQVDIYQVI